VSSSKTAWALLALVIAAFTWGIVDLYGLRLAGGDIYPPYSSFRADPLGAKVLYESVAELPGFSARRNLRTLDHWRGGGATLLWLGEDPFNFALRPDADFKQFEDVASQGVRVVIAMTPVKPVAEKSLAEVKGTPLEKRWGVTFTYEHRRLRSSQETSRALPKRTALIMTAGGQAGPVIEKPFGKGTVVLVANAFPFSNEALATERDTAFLTRVLGANREIVFDENHLGYSETASIAGLARRYRLWGLAAGLLAVAALFIWRNSSPLVPATSRERAQADEALLAAGRDSTAALRHLLRRNIAQKDIVATCLAEWERSGRGGRYYSPEKLDIIRKLGAASASRDPLEAYRTLQSVVTQRE
jgi:hypothetical protein